MSLGSLKVFKLLQQMSLLYLSGQSQFLVVFVGGGGGNLALLLAYYWLKTAFVLVSRLRILIQ